MAHKGHEMNSLSNKTTFSVIYYFPTASLLFSFFIMSCMVAIHTTMSDDCLDCKTTEIPPINVDDESKSTHIPPSLHNENPTTIGSTKSDVVVVVNSQLPDPPTLNSQQNTIGTSDTTTTPKLEFVHPQHFIEHPVLFVAPLPNSDPVSRQIIMSENPETGEIVFTTSYPTWMGRYLLQCLPTIYSCEHSCGEQMPPQNTPGIKRKCSCDKACRYFGDCCQDYFSKCESLHTEERVEEFLNQFPNQFTPEENENRDGDGDEYTDDVILSNYGACTSTVVYPKGADVSSLRSFWLVNKCPHSRHEDHDLQQACENEPVRKLFSFPVSHRWNPKLVFKNIYCAFCHGLELRDISFWPVQIHCNNLELQLTWSVDELLAMLESDDNFCQQSMAPTMPDSQSSFRQCNDLNEARCAKINSQAVDPEQSSTPRSSQSSLDEKLCNAYLRPFEFHSETHANIHCLACRDPDQASTEEVAERMCSIWTTSGHAFLRTNYMAEVSFVYDKFSVYTRSKETGNMNEIFESVRHQNCTGSSTLMETNPMQIFFEDCPETHSCEVGKLPGTDVLPHELQCSIIHHRYDGEYRNHNQSLGGYLININLTVPHKILAENLRILSVGFGEVFTSARLDDPNVEFELQTIHFHESSTENIISLGIIWKTGDKLVSVLREAAVIDENLRNVFGKFETEEPIQSRPQINSFVLSNFVPKSLTCESNNIMEFNHANVVEFHFQTFVVIEKSWCYFDLEQLPFATSYTGNGKAPSSIDSVFVCQDHEIQYKCGVLFPEEIGETNEGFEMLQPTRKSGNDGNLNKLNTDEDDGFQKDVNIFQVICFSTCALGKIVKIVSSFISLVTGRYKDKAIVIFKLNRLISNMILIVLISLILISKELEALNEFAMGVTFHCCWLVLAGTNLIMAFKRNGIVMYSIIKRLSQTIFLVVVIDIVVCCIMEEGNNFGAKVGYSHKTNHLFWISDNIACSVALVAVCSTFFCLSYCIRIVRFHRNAKLDVESTDVKKLCPKKGWMSAKLKSEDFLGVLFLISVIDYYQTMSSLLWTLLFGVAAFCLGVWQLLTVIAFYQGDASRGIQKPDVNR